MIPGLAHGYSNLNKKTKVLFFFTEIIPTRNPFFTSLTVCFVSRNRALSIPKELQEKFAAEALRLDKQERMPKRKRKDGGDEVNFKGVYKNRKKFQGKISIDGKIKSLGTFDTAKEAAQAYDRAAIEAGRPTSKLNFLDEVPKIYKPKNNGLHPRNTTGFTGVYQRGKRFEAKISIGGGKQQNIGRYGTAKEAAEAYDQVALLANFPRSELNFSDTTLKAKEDQPKIKKKKIIPSTNNSTNKTKFSGVSKHV